jgi:hypothetical protein
LVSGKVSQVGAKDGIQFIAREIDIDCNVVWVTHSMDCGDNVRCNWQIGREIIIDRRFEQKHFVLFEKRVEVELFGKELANNIGNVNAFGQTPDVNVIQIVFGKVQICIWVFRKLRIRNHRVLLIQSRRYHIDQVVYIEFV